MAATVEVLSKELPDRVGPVRTRRTYVYSTVAGYLHDTYHPPYPATRPFLHTCLLPTKCKCRKTLFESLYMALHKQPGQARVCCRRLNRNFYMYRNPFGSCPAIRSANHRPGLRCMLCVSVSSCYSSFQLGRSTALRAQDIS